MTANCIMVVNKPIMVVNITIMVVNIPTMGVNKVVTFFSMKFNVNKFLYLKLYKIKISILMLII